ncbi:hypothetical protein KR032_003673, partial [Drosophila birchii]
MEFPIPEAPFRNVYKNLEEERQIFQKCIPETVSQAISDVGEVYIPIDTCYLNCQRYVHHYSDPYSKLHCPKFLLLQRRKCGIQLDSFSALMTQSIAGNMNLEAIHDRSFPMVPANS